MRVDEQGWADVVAAAQAGDQVALDDLVAQYLPLVYNIVGRALDGHLDVDDVVQETMLRAVGGLDGLRDPESFRSWLVAIAMRQVRDRARVQRTAQTYAGHVLDEERDRADPGSDFVDLTILRLHLDGQRQEAAEATRWLDEDDRHLLSLWWLEVAGRLTRRELADALELTPQHAAVRVQRVKAQLEAARSVVRAMNKSPRCYEFATLALEWDGRPSPLWRKRLARHTRGCAECGGVAPDQVPAERLLVGLALVPLPVGFALKVLAGLTATTGAAATTTAAVGAAGHGGFGTMVKAGFQLAMKPVVATTAGVTLVAGGAAVVYQASQDSAGGPLPRATAPATSASAAVRTPPSPSPSPSLVPGTSAPAPTSAAPSPQSQYGNVVDVADKAPDPNHEPGALPKRPVGTFTSTGGAKAVLAHNSDTVTLKGRGYFRIRWQIGTTGGRIGVLNPASWTGLRGKLFHVASGGGRRMDDQFPGTTDGQSGMGSRTTGYDTLPPGAQQMWQNEYYYLDGEVTLHNNESPADYSLIVEPRTWDEINADIHSGPPQGTIRYGVVRDTGNDSAPVPQYVTRSTTADPRTVSQRSSVRMP